MRFKRNEEKSVSNKSISGTSFEEAVIAIKNEIVGGMRNDDPEQYYSVGFELSGKMITVIYELREDEKGAYIWLVTLWKTTKEEKARIK